MVRRVVRLGHHEQLHGTRRLAHVAPPISGGTELAEFFVHLSDLRIPRSGFGTERGEVVGGEDGTHRPRPYLGRRAGHRAGQGDVVLQSQRVEQSQGRDRDAEVDVQHHHVTTAFVLLLGQDVLQRDLAELSQLPHPRGLGVPEEVGVVPVLDAQRAIRVVRPAAHEVDRVLRLLVGPGLEPFPRAVLGIVLEHDEGELLFRLLEERGQPVHVLSQRRHALGHVPRQGVDDEPSRSIAEVVQSPLHGEHVVGIARRELTAAQLPPLPFAQTQRPSVGDAAILRVEARALQRGEDGLRQVGAIPEPQEGVPEDVRAPHLEPHADDHGRREQDRQAGRHFHLGPQRRVVRNRGRRLAAASERAAAVGDDRAQDHRQQDDRPARHVYQRAPHQVHVPDHGVGVEEPPILRAVVPREERQPEQHGERGEGARREDGEHLGRATAGEAGEVAMEGRSLDEFEEAMPDVVTVSAAVRRGRALLVERVVVVVVPLDDEVADEGRGELLGDGAAARLAVPLLSSPPFDVVREDLGVLAPLQLVVLSGVHRLPI
mmetsp:Transcript_45657/g.97037  ORF Transcript_45657/g.97037 Transcript_45657/m.97037 type:complete len:545 (-) Transcript_45657:41-1675(-)